MTESNHNNNVRSVVARTDANVRMYFLNKLSKGQQINAHRNVAYSPARVTGTRNGAQSAYHENINKLNYIMHKPCKFGFPFSFKCDFNTLY